MKKVLAFILVAVMLLSFAACGKEEERGTASNGNVVEKNTVEIVNSAYAATGKAFSESKAMGYSGNLIKTTTVDESETVFRMSVDLDYADTDSGRQLAAETIAKIGSLSEEAQLYHNGTDFYGNKAGETYIFTKHKDTDTFCEELLKDIEFFDATDITVINTTIVDTANGGHGFVLEYDVNDEDFDPLKTIGEDMYYEPALGITVTKTGLTVSGIIDADGRLTEQKITFSYTYNQEVEVQKEDVDPDNSGAVTTEKVTKTYYNTIEYQIEMDYDLVEVKMPDRIKASLTPAEDEEPEQPEEISVSDFGSLSAGSSEDSDEED